MLKYILLIALAIMPFADVAQAHEEHLHQAMTQDASTKHEAHTIETLIQYQIENAAEILGGEGVLNNLGVIDPLTRAHYYAENGLIDHSVRTGHDAHGAHGDHGETVAQQVLGVSTEAFTKNLTLGMTDAEVLRLQKFLNERGFTVAVSGPGSKGQESTYFGLATVAALKRYQEAHADSILRPNNLTVGTGLFLASTRNHVNKSLTTPVAVPPTSKTSTIITPPPKTSPSTGTIVPPKNSTVTKNQTYTLVVKRTGLGSVSTSNGQTCSTTDCVFVFDRDSRAVLTAAPLNSTAAFVWGGECRGTKSKCSVLMNKDKNISIIFREKRGTSSGGGGGSTPTPTPTPTPTSTPAVTFVLTSAVSGSGTVSGSTISCPSNCAASYPSGTVVTLTAVAQPGHSFAGWSGACSGTSSTCTVTMSQARTVNASFAVIPPPPTPPAPVSGGVNQPTPNAYNPGWEFCSNLYFGGCTFTGLRDIRYGAPGRWTTREYLNDFAGYNCHPNVFRVSGQPGDRCEVATEMKTGTLAAPTVTVANLPYVDRAAIPLGSKGSNSLNIVSTSDNGVNSDIGAFRIPCVYSHMAYNDPIVYPGQPGASHLHTFFGNTGITGNTTANSLATTGSSTCPGGIANRSSYWIPSLIDTANGKPQVPTEAIWYYKTGYRGVTPASVQQMPAGLRVIAGNSATATAVPTVPSWEVPYSWGCQTATGQHTNQGFVIPNCAAGDKVEATIIFPQCWDGVNLDSSNHRSHMAYASNGCPSSHPVPLAELSLNMRWTVETPGQAQNFRLSSDINGNPAGVTLHADFFEAWRPDVKQTLTTNCLNASRDCHAYLLGNGTMLGTEQ